MTDKITVVYIMGAGRSGSTLLTTLIGGSSTIFSSADLMQYYNYVCENKVCGDGNRISESPFWVNVLKSLPSETAAISCEIDKRNYELEHHSAFLKNFLGLTNKDHIDRYLQQQKALINAVAQESGKNVIVDSSKYANRAFLLNRLDPDIDVKFIYNIRDLRGVINSFSKNVQSPRKPLSALFYYLMVNMLSQIIFWMLPSEKKLKIRYEDLMTDYKKVVSSISHLVGHPMDDVVRKIEEGETFEIGPVIEGNRLVKNKKLKIKYDTAWKTGIPRYKQIIYYLIAAPLMILNRYRI